MPLINSQIIIRESVVCLQILFTVGLTAAVWSLGHSFFISHRWQRWQGRLWPGFAPWSRLVYVLFSTLTLGLLGLWWRSMAHTPVWDWPGPWASLRWAGLAVAGLFFLLGALAYDNGSFLGLKQVSRHLRGKPLPASPFTRRGILARVRHPWYTGTLFFFVFCLPFTDVNLVWRGVFLLYTLIGAELEERKLLSELGSTYSEYKKDVNRFLPWG